MILKFAFKLLITVSALINSILWTSVKMEMGFLFFFLFVKKIKNKRMKHCRNVVSFDHITRKNLSK